MELKNKLTTEKYNKIVEQATICELGYYIGTKKEIDSYIQINLLDEFEGIDSFVLFYMFCKFVVDTFIKSEIADIYELIDYNYIRLVCMFISEYGKEVDE
jgi:hypothetical protein